LGEWCVVTIFLIKTGYNSFARLVAESESIQFLNSFDILYFTENKKRIRKYPNPLFYGV